MRNPTVWKQQRPGLAFLTLSLHTSPPKKLQAIELWYTSHHFLFGIVYFSVCSLIHQAHLNSLYIWQMKIWCAKAALLISKRRHWISRFKKPMTGLAPLRRTFTNLSVLSTTSAGGSHQQNSLLHKRISTSQQQNHLENQNWVPPWKEQGYFWGDILRNVSMS